MDRYRRTASEDAVSAKRLIVESAVKAELKEASGLQVISGEAMDYVNAATVAAVADCAARGRRTPGGRLMAPDAGTIGTVVVRHSVPGSPESSDASRRPERVCARAKEWDAMTPEQKNEHLNRLYILSPSINEEAIDLLKEIVSGSRNLEDGILLRAGEIIQLYEELLK